jgi:hypothetical protein
MGRASRRNTKRKVATRDLQGRIDGIIAAGLNALDQGEPIPTDGSLGYGDIGTLKLRGVAVDPDRVQRLATARGVDVQAIITAAVRLGIERVSST